MKGNFAKLFTGIAAVSLALLVYTLISLFIIPQEGVNAVFVLQLSKMSSLSLLAVLLCFAVLRYISKKPVHYEKRFERWELKDLAVILIPLTPIVQYVFSNQSILNISDSFSVVAFFILICLVFCVIIPVVFSVFADKNLLQISGAGFLYIIFAMASLSASKHWHETGEFSFQIVVTAIVLIALSVVFVLFKKQFHYIFIVFFLVNSFYSLLSLTTQGSSNTGLQQEISGYPIYSETKNKRLAKNNDVIFLVYEAYANEETMRIYGIDNSAQIDYLAQKGFTIYGNAYSNGPCTNSSISGVFSVGMKPQKRYTNKMNAITQRHIVGGSVQTILQSKGYKSLGIFHTDSFFRGLNRQEIKYDYFFPEVISGENSLLIYSILEGEFRHEAGYYKTHYKSYIEKKRRVLNMKNLPPYILYSHSTVPGHSQNSGRCMPDETKKYSKGIKKANYEMQGDIEAIFKTNPDAIIIVAGDHGPYLRRNCAALSRMKDNLDKKDIDRYDIQDRYGLFLAIRWPNKDIGSKYDIRIIQDIFPAVFSYLFDDESLFDKTRAERITHYPNFFTKGVSVKDGIIIGGKDNNQPLFLKDKKPK